MKSIFMILTLIALVLGFRTLNHSEDPALPFAQISDVINLPQLKKITLREAGQETVLEEVGDGKWVVASRYGYPAKPKDVSDLINEIATSRILHRVAKTAKHHERLGLLHPDKRPPAAKPEPPAASASPNPENSADADGKASKDEDAAVPTQDSGEISAKEEDKAYGYAHLAILEFADGKTRELLFANPNPDTKSRQNAAGVHFRFGDEETVYKLAKKPWINYRAQSWLETDLLKIEKDMVRSVEQGGEESESLRISRKAREDAFEVGDLGLKDQVRKSAVESWANAMSSFRIEDIELGATSDETLHLNKPTHVTYDLFDGRRYVMTLGEKYKDAKNEESLFCRFQVSLTENTTDTAVLDTVKTQTEAFGKWAYKISAWSRTSYVKNRPGLVETKIEEKAAGESTKEVSLPSAEGDEIDSMSGDAGGDAGDATDAGDAGDATDAGDAGDATDAGRATQASDATTETSLVVESVKTAGEQEGAGAVSTVVEETGTDSDAGASPDNH